MADARCACFESFSYLNLGYEDDRELGPGEVVVFDAEKVRTLVAPGDKMKICTFLWVYYGYPSASYEGVSVEEMRYNCGKPLARRDNVDVDVENVELASEQIRYQLLSDSVTQEFSRLQTAIGK